MCSTCRNHKTALRIVSTDKILHFIKYFKYYYYYIPLCSFHLQKAQNCTENSLYRQDFALDKYFRYCYYYIIVIATHGVPSTCRSSGGESGAGKQRTADQHLYEELAEFISASIADMNAFPSKREKSLTLQDTVSQLQQHVTGKPTQQHVTGKPAQQHVSSKPTQQHTGTVRLLCVTPFLEVFVVVFLSFCVCVCATFTLI